MKKLILIAMISTVLGKENFSMNTEKKLQPNRNC